MKNLNLGMVITTASISIKNQENAQFAEFCQKSLDRHKIGDWGDMCEDDKVLNDLSYDCGDKILSTYEFPSEIKIIGHQKIYIITEADRSATTILFPSEY